MAQVAAGAAIVGAGLAVYGQIKSAQDQADLLALRQDAANSQADEIESRQRINEAFNLDSARQRALDFGSAYAASGKSGVGVGSMLEIQRQAELKNVLSRKDSYYRAAQLRLYGGSLGLEAGQTISSGYWNAGGSLMTGIGRVASSSAMQPNSGQPTGMTKPTYLES